MVDTVRPDSLANPPKPTKEFQFAWFNMLKCGASIQATNKTHGMPSLGLACCSAVIVCLFSFQAPAENSEPGVRNGDAYVAEVLAAMERRPNVTAKLRYESRLGDETLMGAGNFWQLGTGPQRLTRWEMQTQVADKSASYVQVFDGRYLWTDRHLPSGRQVRRLDVGNLKARLRSSVGTTATPSDWEDLISGAEFRGGLSQMLADLLRRYQFAAPRATELNGFALDALIGHWRPEQFAELCPLQGEDQAWPAQLPHHVLLMVGRNNLFPYLIEFRRAEDANLAENLSGLQPARDPLTRYEIFEVRFADATDSLVFQFKPGDVDWSDETSLVYDRVNKQHDAAEAQIAARKARVPK
jgi:hypothetical protein